MASCDITIRIPDELAISFSQKVPAAEQSEFLVADLRKSLKSRLTPAEKAEREAAIIAACEAVNDMVEEPWD